MKFRSDRRHVFMDNAPADGAPAGGAAPAAPAPAAPAAPAASAPAAAPSPAPAESLMRAAAAPAPAAEPAAPGAEPPAAPGEFDHIPEKYRVTGADGKLDLTASTKKLADGLSAAVKRIGTGDLPPDTPDGYTFDVPEALKDVPVEEVLGPFRERALKAGLTLEQFKFVAGEYFELVPDMLNGAAKVKAEDARAELQKVWTSPADFETNLSASARAVAALPKDLQEQVHAKFGTDPLALQAFAALGREMREDTPPSGGAGSQATATVEQLMGHPAYRDSKHPEHKSVSERVQAMSQRLHGSAPAM